MAASVSGSVSYGLGDARAHRQVDDADVVRHAVGDGPVEGRDDVADDAAAVLVEHLQADQVRRRRDARVRAVRVVAVAGDDAGDVRPVAVVVVGLRQTVDEVDEAGHALAADDANSRRAAAVAEVVVPAGDARVDDRHADAGAVIAPVLLRRAGADRDRGAAVVPRIGRSKWTLSTSERSADLLDDAVRQLDGHAVDELEPTAETAAELPDFLFGVGFLPRLDRDDHLGGARAAGPSATASSLSSLSNRCCRPECLLALALLVHFLLVRAGLGGHRDRERDESREHECRGLPRKLTLSRTHWIFSFGYLPNLGSGHSRLPMDTRLHPGGGSMSRRHQCTAAPQTALARRQSSRTIDQSAWSK